MGGLTHGVGVGRPVKRRLTPLQRDVLVMLSEAGEEEFACLLNTLRPWTEPVGPFRGRAERALDDLERRGLIYMSPGKRDATVVLTGAGRRSLTQ